MGNMITLESELRVLEVDPQDIVKRIEGLGAKKLFDGELNTQLFRSHQSGAETRTARLRHYKGMLYISAAGSAITKLVDYTERVIKLKIPKVSVSDTPGSNTRRYEEQFQARYDGNCIDALAHEYRALGIEDYARDVRFRTSYIINEVRFELDVFTKTKRLGDMRLPMMLEVETPDDNLTREIIQKLGFGFEEVIAPGILKVTDWNFKDIFDYYAKQASKEAE